MLLVIESLIILFIFYIVYKSIVVDRVLNISKSLVITILVVAFLAIPALIKTMIVIILMVYFIVKVASKHNNITIFRKLLR